MPKTPLVVLSAAVLAVALTAPSGSMAAKPTTQVRLATKTSPVLPRQARRGLAFAQARCAGCHGVTASTTSPNPESPPFEEVVNKPGLTRTTLRRFLRDSHNYPQAMNFTIERARLDELTSYMLTLRRRGFRPGI